ncbi:homocysteine S-methyltransferase 3-like [Prosopis cineraria]|uniref:homocysteine S-methyltransferase 3-like n=1 Tax=Prosopis cineraria TaxID=364024 RepID=UPI00240F979B|nr:homocysteine S-methyltransferase 3-like [Prosopis cineraria]
MGFKGKHTSFVFTDFLHQCGGYAVIDGGFATELEGHGADLNDPLWSAKCLLVSPHLVRRVHLDYLNAGASIIITGSYQATIQGFEAQGLSEEEGENLIRRSVELAREARDIYYDRCTIDSSDFIRDGRYWRRPILIAASVGSYGAYLADGSEYSGDYGDTVTVETLKDFHRRRVKILVDAGADIIAFETIPNKLEAQVFSYSIYVRLHYSSLDEEGIDIPAWLSFSCRDESKVASGDSILECASIAESCKQVVAVGVNCTAPRFIHGLVSSITKVTSKPVLAYPNSGETYDPETKTWKKICGVVHEDFVSYIGKWREAGASLFGGCCRTTPDTVRGIAKALSGKASEDDDK